MAARFKGIPLEAAKKEEEEWQQWRALARTGCSIPAHLLKYQRRHEDYLKRQAIGMPGYPLGYVPQKPDA